MKSDIHPQNYRLVVFEDLNNQTNFLVKSTIESQETVKYKDGQTYPLVKLHVTSASHPYYTGLEKVIDIEGRIDKFKSRQARAQATKAQLQAKSMKALKNKPSKSPVKSMKALKKSLLKTPSPEAKVASPEEPAKQSPANQPSEV